MTALLPQDPAAPLDRFNRTDPQGRRYVYSKLGLPYACTSDGETEPLQPVQTEENGLASAVVGEGVQS